MNIQNILLSFPTSIRNIFINIYGSILAFRRFNRDFIEYSSILNYNLSKAKDQIQCEQINLLKKTLIYSYENIPYYNRVFKLNNFVPYEFSSFEQLKDIPFLTKEVIRNNFNNLYNTKYPRTSYITHSTSGSTGEKLKFYLPKDLFYAKNAAFQYRLYSLLNIKPKDRRVTIGGRVFTNKYPFWVYNKAENQLLLSSHHLSVSTVNKYLEIIDKFQPILIQGHPSSILFLAKEKLDSFSRMPLNLKGIFTTGETLIEEDRKIIELAFNTTVLQQYGCGESCFSAQETPEKMGYMLNYEHGFIELVGSGIYREVVATSFLNPVMPFIRYKVGDFVRPIYSNVNSKYNFPFLFDKVLGRIDDILVDIYGREILPVTIRSIIKPYLKEYTNYQLIQKGLVDYILRLVDNERKIDTDKLCKNLVEVLGPKSQIKVEYIKSIISTKGKIRNVIKEVEK